MLSVIFAPFSEALVVHSIRVDALLRTWRHPSRCRPRLDRHPCRAEVPEQTTLSASPMRYPDVAVSMASPTRNVRPTSARLRCLCVVSSCVPLAGRPGP